MKVTIVRFKDGQYGIRRRFLFEYRFLDTQSYSADYARYWWSTEYFKKWCVVGSLEEARKVVNDLRANRKNKALGPDFGEPVEEHTV